MKLLAIAFKDLTRSFRSAFLLMFMFVIPLLVTGMFYLMFGSSLKTGQTAQAEAAPMAKVRLVIANLDQGSELMTQGMQDLAGVVPTSTIFPESMGQALIDYLQGDAFKSRLEVSLAPDAAGAKAAVDGKQASAALIIPADFSTAYASQAGGTIVEMYPDGADPAGQLVIKTILTRFLDTLSGMKIAINLTVDSSVAQDATSAAARIAPVVQQYMEVAAGMQDPAQAPLEVHPPAKTGPLPDPSADAFPLTRILGPIMGGMLIFFAFFTGTATAETILTEDEAGTLPRLFTTPTPRAVILGGKFLAVFMTVLVQVIVQFIAGSLIFRIYWGSLIQTGLVAAGVILSASAFGIFFNSLLKNTRQAGVLVGGVLTVTGMVGMMGVFTPGSAGSSLLGSTIPLFAPQGWAVRGLLLALNHASTIEIGLNLLVVLAWTIIFFAVGTLRFQKRYA